MTKTPKYSDQMGIYMNIWNIACNRVELGGQPQTHWVVWHSCHMMKVDVTFTFLLRLISLPSSLLFYDKTSRWIINIQNGNFECTLQLHVPPVESVSFTVMNSHIFWSTILYHACFSYLFPIIHTVHKKLIIPVLLFR